MTLNAAIPSDSRHPASVFLISNHSLLITGMKVLLSPLTVVDGDATDINIVQQAAPHVIILDMKDSTVLSLIPTLKHVVPYAKIILVAELENMPAVCDAYRSAIDGVVLTTQPPEVLVAMVKGFMPQIGRTATPPPEAHQHSAGTWPLSLTEQERHIVRLISEGLSNKDIARYVCTSPTTVRHLLTQMFSKLR